MTPKGSKAKGKRFSKYVAHFIAKTLGVAPSDVRVPPTSVPGVDVWLSLDAFNKFPFGIECKHVEKLNIHDALKQAKANCKIGSPLVIFTRNHDEVYCALKLSDFMNALGYSCIHGRDV